MAFVPLPLRVNQAQTQVTVNGSAQAEAPVLSPGPESVPIGKETIHPAGTLVNDSGFASIVTAPERAMSSTATAPSGSAQMQSIDAPPLGLGTTPATSPDERSSAVAQQLDVLIAMLEEDIRLRKAEPGNNLQLARNEQQLRLLYAAAQRPDDAARAIDSLSESENEGFKHLMFGLSTWLAEDEARRGPLRNARLLRSLRDVSSALAAASKLDLRNLAFCEHVESFGWYSEFSRNEFLPKQQVILYVEVDNFLAQEKGPHSFETELQGRYQVFDARGQIVAERQLPLDREICRNFRRDYFLAYPIYIPENLTVGRYRLELTIEDLKAGKDYQGRKFGEGMIEFAVRG